MAKHFLVTALLISVLIGAVQAVYFESRGSTERADSWDTLIEIPNCYRAWKACPFSKRSPPMPALKPPTTFENIGHLQPGGMNISFDMEWRSPEERVRALVPKEDSWDNSYWPPRDHWARIVYAQGSCVESWHCRIQCSDDILEYPQRFFVGDIEEPVDINPGNYCHSSDKYNDIDQFKDLWIRYGNGHTVNVIDDCDLTNHEELVNYDKQKTEKYHQMAFCAMSL